MLWTFCLGKVWFLLSEIHVSGSVLFIINFLHLWILFSLNIEFNQNGAIKWADNACIFSNHQHWLHLFKICCTAWNRSLTNTLFANFFLITKEFCTCLWHSHNVVSSLFNPVQSELKLMRQHSCHMTMHNCFTSSFNAIFLDQMQLGGTFKVWNVPQICLWRFLENGTQSSLWWQGLGFKLSGLQRLGVTYQQLHFKLCTHKILHSSHVYTPFLNLDLNIPFYFLLYNILQHQ